MYETPFIRIDWSIQAYEITLTKFIDGIKAYQIEKKRIKKRIYIQPSKTMMRSLN